LLPVSATVDFVAGFGNSRLCCRFRQQSTFNKVDRLELNFVASVYRALSTSQNHVSNTLASFEMK